MTRQLKNLLKKFNLEDNGKWRKVPATVGRYPYFWFNPDYYHGGRVWIAHNLLNGEWVVKFDTPSQWKEKK